MRKIEKILDLSNRIFFTISLKTGTLHILRTTETKSNPNPNHKPIDKNGMDISKREYQFYMAVCGKEIPKDWPIGREHWFECGGSDPQMHGTFSHVCGECLLQLVEENLFVHA